MCADSEILLRAQQVGEALKQFCNPVKMPSYIIMRYLFGFLSQYAMLVGVPVDLSLSLYNRVYQTKYCTVQYIRLNNSCARKCQTVNL